MPQTRPDTQAQCWHEDPTWFQLCISLTEHPKPLFSIVIESRLPFLKSKMKISVNVLDMGCHQVSCSLWLEAVSVKKLTGKWNICVRELFPQVSLFPNLKSWVDHTLAEFPFSRVRWNSAQCLVARDVT